ncbi:MAG: hypothetical protein ACOYL8_02865 [Patescibacteria group bacterium]
MKIILILLLLFFGRLYAAEEYEIVEKFDKNKSFIIYSIRQNNEELATLCLIDPMKNFKFYSEESDSSAFVSIEENISSFAEKKYLGRANCAIFADFSKIKKNKAQFNFSYFWESLGILIYAPPYIKKVGIINSADLANRYFIEISINDKEFYCLIAFKSSVKNDYAKKIVKKVGAFKKLDFKLIPIINFPLKLVSYENKKTTVIYESKKGHNKYSCLFLSAVN